MIRVIVTPPLGEQLKSNLTAEAERMKRALKDATQTASEQILERGRADIAGAGRFGTRWTEGLTADVEENDKGGTSITVRQAVPYWRVFEYGATIYGKPLLWIPLPGVDPSEKGDFFQTSRKGNLLLFKGGGGNITPLRVGKPSVTIPQKFHIVQICHDVAAQVGALYRINMNG